MSFKADVSKVETDLRDAVDHIHNVIDAGLNEVHERIDTEVHGLEERVIALEKKTVTEVHTEAHKL